MRLANFCQPVHIVLRCRGVPHLNAVQSQVNVFLNFVKVVIKRRMRQYGNTACAVHFLQHFLNGWVLGGSQHVGLALSAEQRMEQIAEDLIGVTGVHQGVHNMLLV